jgi:hypothetical protein
MTAAADDREAVREARRRIAGDAAIDLWLERHAQGLCRD